MKKLNDILYDLQIVVERQEEIFRETDKSLKKLISSLQNLCEHKETKYVPDASGNNDSYYYCLVCGLEKKRF